MASIKFRLHHFLCTLSFQGKGYSSLFVKNYQDIVNRLTEETEIEVIHYTDDICSACPHKRGLECVQQSKIEKLDRAHQEVLQLSLGCTLTWKEAKALIKKNMTLEKFHAACASCEWKKYGICEKALSDFLASE